MSLISHRNGKSIQHAGTLTEKVSVISADYIIKQLIITNDFLPAFGQFVSELFRALLTSTL